MLSVTGLNHFYYVRDFTDMRCKHSRVLSIIRERLQREPRDLSLIHISTGILAHFSISIYSFRVVPVGG